MRIRWWKNEVIGRWLAAGLVAVVAFGPTTARAQSIQTGALEWTLAVGGGASLPDESCRGFEPVPKDWRHWRPSRALTLGPDLDNRDLKRANSRRDSYCWGCPKLPGEALAVAGLLKRPTPSYPTGSAVPTAPSRPPGR
jgi:hypothetical protein